eukprot:4826565-Karenia_brevis.AAC.1
MREVIENMGSSTEKRKKGMKRPAAASDDAKLQATMKRPAAASDDAKLLATMKRPAAAADPDQKKTQGNKSRRAIGT